MCPQTEALTQHQELSHDSQTNIQLLWEPADSDVTVGQSLLSGENRYCPIVKSNSLSEGQWLMVDWGL